MSLRTKIISLVLLVTTGMTAAVVAAPEVELPKELAAKIASLPKEKQDYLKSDKIRQFARNRASFYNLLARKTPQAIEAAIDAMMSVEDQMKFKEGRDMAAIPLNTDSPSFNGWKVKRPQELNPAREPGPIVLNRYMQNWGGIPTFFGAPVALTPEDLKAGNVDVAIVGAPLDMGSGFRGASLGPVAIRTTRMGAGLDMYTMTSPAEVLNIVDYGDIGVDNMSTERSMEHVREMVREIASTGAIPFIVGGDHSLMYSDAAGLADVYGKGNIGVVHFDSHYDAGRGRAHLITHGQPVYRLISEGHVPGKNFIQVGLRAQSPDLETFKWMREQGFRYHTMPEVEKKGWDAVMEQALAEAREGGKKIFISFDIDVLDPVYMVGTGTPVPSGLTMREAVPMIRRLCAESDVVGFELVELAPGLDPTYQSALNSAYIMHACLAGIAVRKQGITEEHYLHPISTDHGQPPVGKVKARK